ncbi:uncharacterized protein LOC126738800 [Anthonomus grandis grandis]|uniref:uncharacterized protein LOC126738800 n=1 Tax=Anthonomus grandis grandis TaxID=2921223 RepID=UPI0021661C23|nr:uncharacterized protein LOC126738800 [Anthonomus grandis grandis]
MNKLTQKLLTSRPNILTLRFLTSDSIKAAKLSSAEYNNAQKSSEAPPFVILHGLLGSKQNWTSLCKAFAQKIEPSRKIVALDLRNHGESEHTEEHTYEHMVEDLKHFLQERKIDKMTLMGHSMGGRCSMLFALKYPEFLEKLIVVDISPIGTVSRKSELVHILSTLEKIEMPKDMPLSKAGRFVEDQLAKEFHENDLRKFLLTNLTSDGKNGFKWRVNVPALIKNIEHITDYQLSERQYIGSTLFIGGEKSQHLPLICINGQLPKYGLTFKYNTVSVKMTLFQIFSAFRFKIFAIKCIPKNVRFKADLAQTNQNYRSIIDMAYASYQSTDSMFGKINQQDVLAPLVIVHGILGSKANFNTLCKRYHQVSKPKRLIFAVDLRNHGDSSHSKDNSYDDLVMDMLKFLQSMGLGKVVVMGHDIGGRTAMLLALKYPELVEKLIVSDISPISTSHSFKVFPEVLKTLNTLVFPPNLPPDQAKAHVVNCLSRIVKSKGLMTLILMSLVPKSEGSYTWRFNNKVLLEHFEELAAFPDIHNLSYTGPTMFVGGGKSDFIQRSDYPKIQKLFPNSELKYIEGAGHWVHAEKPNEFFKMTMDFLSKKTS